MNSFQVLWLLALLLLWACLLFGGFIFGSTNAQRNRRMPTRTRIASSLTLVLAAWSWYLFTLHSPLARYSLFIALGMILGCLGDLFLARVIPFSHPTLGGIASFGLGHIAYITAFLAIGNLYALTAPAPRWLAWFVWLLVGLVGWYMIVFRDSKPTVLRIAALPYTLLLASTAGIATGLAVQDVAFLPLAIGGGLFLLSDLILAAELFRGAHFPLLGDVVWLTYGPAQMLIVYAIYTHVL